MSTAPVSAALETWGQLWPNHRILFRSASILAVNKPAGINTHAARPDECSDVAARLKRFVQVNPAGDGAATAPPGYLGTHQRLDKETSGVLLFATSKEANAPLAAEFEAGRARKVYIAAVDRWTLDQKGSLTHVLAEEKGRITARQRGAGKTAHLTYEVLAEHKSGRTLLRIEPKTGRTHQIRAQLAAAGAPIAGDRIYHGPAAYRLLLHAHELFVRPAGIEVPSPLRAPVPVAFERWLEAGADEMRDLPEGELGVRITEAAERRYDLLHSPDTNAFRLLNSEGDGVAGFGIDWLNGVAIVSMYEPRNDAREAAVFDATVALGAATVFVKRRPKVASSIAPEQMLEAAPADPVRGPPLTKPITIEENGLQFAVEPTRGLSFGLFLDQRANRARCRELAKDARVLNLFGYTGGFSVAALAGGASHVTTIDISASALAIVTQNIALNGLDAHRHTAVAEDALGWLARPKTQKEFFDLITLDPPTFSTTKHGRFEADRDYAKLAALALKRLSPGGSLLACTNQRSLSLDGFRRDLHAAVHEAGIQTAQIKNLPEPVDFPAIAGTPCHLKSVLLRRQP